jgi:hypothetical protein
MTRQSSISRAEGWSKTVAGRSSSAKYRRPLSAMVKFLVHCVELACAKTTWFPHAKAQFADRPSLGHCASVAEPMKPALL